MKSLKTAERCFYNTEDKRLYSSSERAKGKMDKGALYQVKEGDFCRKVHKLSYDKEIALHCVREVGIEENIKESIEDIEHIEEASHKTIKFYEDQNHEAQVKFWVGKALCVEETDITDIQRLGGRTNKSFKFTLNQQGYKIDDKNFVAKGKEERNNTRAVKEPIGRANEFVVRFPGNGTDEFIDRKCEKFNADLAYKLGLDSETVYFHEATGFKICRYIQGAETLSKEEGRKDENIKLMAEGLRTLHCSGKKFKREFNPFKEINLFEQVLEDVTGKVSQEYKAVKKQCMALEARLKRLGLHRVPCHIDPLPENFIRVGRDKIYVIDWEYSGNYDAMWDLAAVSLECDFTEAEEKELLRSYFQGINIEEAEAIKEKLKIYKIVQDMYWCTWAAAKAAKGDDYLVEYAKFKFQRVQKFLNLYQC